jgi:hypothetical protein
MNAHPTWIDHFPENFTWSNAMLVTKGMAPYGAVALEEIERIAEPPAQAHGRSRRLVARQPAAADRHAAQHGSHPDHAHTRNRRSGS